MKQFKDISWWKGKMAKMKKEQPPKIYSEQEQRYRKQHGYTEGMLVLKSKGINKMRLPTEQRITERDEYAVTQKRYLAKQTPKRRMQLLTKG